VKSSSGPVIGPRNRIARSKRPLLVRSTTSRARRSVRDQTTAEFSVTSPDMIPDGSAGRSRRTTLGVALATLDWIPGTAREAPATVDAAKSWRRLKFMPPASSAPVTAG
jgi:hypothetical protein